MDWQTQKFRVISTSGEGEGALGTSDFVTFYFLGWVVSKWVLISSLFIKLYAHVTNVLIYLVDFITYKLHDRFHNSYLNKRKKMFPEKSFHTHTHACMRAHAQAVR
jgi:hypothetical protein